MRVLLIVLLAAVAAWAQVFETNAQKIRVVLGDKQPNTGAVLRIEPAD